MNPLTNTEKKELKELLISMNTNPTDEEIEFLANSPEDIPNIRKTLQGLRINVHQNIIYIGEKNPFQNN